MAQSERYHPAAPGARLGELPRPLDGRVAIVTGAAGGLGAVIWRSLHAAGATAVPVDLHGDGCLIADVSRRDVPRDPLAPGFLV